MLRIFRKARQKMIQNKRLGNYLLYAAGEVVLVVIGILLALGINNMQEDRVLQRKQQAYLSGLQEEFELSRRKLETLMAVNQQNYQNGRRLLALAGSPTHSFPEDTLSNLLYQTLALDIAYNPNNALLEEMVSSGSLRHIKDTNLRIRLTTWLSAMQDIERQEEDLRMQRERVLDLFRGDEYSLWTVLASTEHDPPPDRESDMPFHSNLPLLQSRAFENRLLLFTYACASTDQAHYQPLMSQLDDILELLKRALASS